MDQSTERKIEIFAPCSAALDLTKLILFQPFDLTKWFVIGFAAFLSHLAGGGGGSFNYNPNLGRGNWNFRSTTHDVFQSATGMPSWVLPLVGVAVLDGGRDRGRADVAERAREVYFCRLHCAESRSDRGAVARVQARREQLLSVLAAGGGDCPFRARTGNDSPLGAVCVEGRGAGRSGPFPRHRPSRFGGAGHGGRRFTSSPAS